MILILCFIIGTGKTDTLVALLRSLSSCQSTTTCVWKIHACAPTNIAVSELASRYLKAITASQVITANDDNNNNNNNQSLRLNQILLIGDKTK